MNKYLVECFDYIIEEAVQDVLLLATGLEACMIRLGCPLTDGLQ